MELKEFKEKSLELVLGYLTAVNSLIKSEKIGAETKHKLIATALSLTLYIEEEYKNLLEDIVSQ